MFSLHAADEARNSALAVRRCAHPFLIEILRKRSALGTPQEAEALEDSSRQVLLCLLEGDWEELIPYLIRFPEPLLLPFVLDALILYVKPNLVLRPGLSRHGAEREGRKKRWHS